MNWRNWPYWLRGGVIGGMLPFLSLLSGRLCIYFTTPPFWTENLGLQCIPFFVTFIPIWLTPYASFFESTPVVPASILYVILGVLLGLLVERIKKSKKKSPLA